ncbi:TfoX/Sxy family protein [Rhodococcoides kyotonense]|uniref:TfoX N-terminal domain-containing protein n=1 Tax=Rhodococcoides kyotonense TaxID=398843 RepID=A0A239KEW4_9NOCA|nr:TfoX/Sxy family protein [Rhodococcus kyotonensis]SNT16530.1 TfoX N-terminal domain-containing protein [Rhodococcus kyotonensis]
MTYDVELADRIRDALTGEPSVVEKKMFGGLQFMVRGKIAVGAHSDGGLLVKTDPSRTDELVARPGARRAVMGDRDMGNGWIIVSSNGFEGAGLDFWVGVALEHNAKRI